MACASACTQLNFDPRPSCRARLSASRRPDRELSAAMTRPATRRSAMVNAGSPDPAAKSSTRESGFSLAAESSASVIAVFQLAAAPVHRSLTRARAAASHESRSVIPSKCMPPRCHDKPNLHRKNIAREFRLPQILGIHGRRREF